MNDYLKKIIEDKVPCYFVSPHLDDAALSAGGLIAYLSQYTRVEIISVFTKAASKPHTLSAKAFLKQCSASAAEKLFSERMSEDKRAWAVINKVPIHLNYTDALWRKVEAPGLTRRLFAHVLPEFLHVYPTYRLHIVRDKISQYDTPLAEKLSVEFKKLVGNGRCVVFCPLATGSHVDHIIVRDICLKNFDNVFLWEDFPYNTRSAMDTAKVALVGTEAFRFADNLDTKREIIESYGSQVRAMFPSGHIQLMPEVYYSPLKKNV